MKLFFAKDHSLYKIFKTLEKIPNNKNVNIYIEIGHSIYENEWWGKQLQEIINRKNLNVQFITKNEKTRKFYTNLGFKTLHQQQNKIIKYLNLVYLFIFNIKKFHLYVYNKKNFVFYIIFFFEIGFIIGILFLLYTLILPSAKIKLYPTHPVENVIYNFRYYPHNDVDFVYNSRYINIPYYTGYIDYKYNMTISTSHLKHFQNPSKGRIKIFNFTNKEYSFIPNTRFITDDGIYFKSNNRFKISTGSDKKPSEKIIKVQAMERDDDGIFIGSRGNIPIGTKLYIKNLNASFYLKEIIAESIENFSGGSLKSEGKVEKQDIGILSGKLINYIQNNKKSIMIDNFKIKDAILLNFNNVLDLEVKDIEINGKIGQKTPNLNGSIIARINYVYIKKEDLERAIIKYLEQRKSQKVKLIKIDFNNLVFFDDMKKKGDIYIISTKIDVVQGYDFEKDVNSIKNELKNELVSKDAKQAKKDILSYPEISSAKIKISPIWYREMPKLKSRIEIDFEN